jgi:hypothetical protein
MMISVLPYRDDHQSHVALDKNGQATRIITWYRIGKTCYASQGCSRSNTVNGRPRVATGQMRVFYSHKLPNYGKSEQKSTSFDKRPLKVHYSS